jgi:hypothetical protein
MIHLRERRLGRRSLLTSAAGAAIALPWLEAFAPRRASARSAAPQRFVVMFSPDGLLPAWTPSGTEKEFTLSTILSPLAPYQDDLVVIRGLYQEGGGGDGHQNGMGGMLTGTTLNAGPFGGMQAPPAGWASGPSVDQRIADAIGNETKLRSLELGVQVGAADNWGRMCYRASDQPLPPEDDPAAVYARVFAELHTDPALLAAERARQKSILDAVGSEYARVSATLGSADRQRLEAHLDAVRELELRLTKVGQIGGAACADPAIHAVAKDDNDAYPEVGALQLDLLAMALACDVTRVASLQWSRSVSQTRFTWLGITDGHHDLSHLGDDDPSAVDKLTRINQWYMAELAALIGKLAAMPEGDGSVLDNTVILYCNELAKGNNHSRSDAGYVLAGRGGGVLETGRFLRFDPSQQIAHNGLLVSLLNAFGIADTQFGKPEWSNGPLPGLL